MPFFEPAARLQVADALPPPMFELNVPAVIVLETDRATSKKSENPLPLASTLNGTLRFNVPTTREVPFGSFNAK